MKEIIEKITIYETSDKQKFKTHEEAVKHEKFIPYGKHYMMLDQCKSFTVTENHLKLIKRANIQFVFKEEGPYYSYFYQDGKRPYGNSDFVGDIAEIIGVEPDCQGKDEDEKWFSDELELTLIKHHVDLKIVMAILCANCSIQPGTYTRESVYSDEWTITT